MATCGNGSEKAISTNDETTDFFSVPQEIIKHHIFGYFTFNKWIALFSLVCTRWKQICETAKISPKQLVLESEFLSFSRAIYFVTKYQPDILAIRYSIVSSEQYGLNLLMKSAKKITTLIFTDYYANERFTRQPIETITTLVLLGVRGLPGKTFFDTFPRIQQFHVDTSESAMNIISTLPDLLPPTCQDVIVTCSDDLKHDFIPPANMTIVNKKTRSVLCKSSSKFDCLSYERHFRLFGETKLGVALSSKDYNTVATLLDTETTLAYETDLITNSRYEYPTVMLPRNELDYSDQLANCEAYEQDAYELLIRTNKIPSHGDTLLATIVKYNCIEDVMLFNPETWVPPKIFQRFIGHPLVTKEVIDKSPIKELVLQFISKGLLYEYFNCKEDFEKISHLQEDWSHLAALWNDFDLFKTMVDKGCYIAFSKLNNRSLDPKIEEYLMGGDPDVRFNFLLHYRGDRVKILMERHNVSATIESNGRSLMNKWICLKKSDEIWLSFPEHFNHMDSIGSTPLEEAIIVYNLYKKEEYITTLLEFGGDPNQHRGDRSSPLALLLSQHQVRLNGVFIAMVVYGADVNAPCLFNERMCSPLMIAVLHNAQLDLIRFLLAVGARVDYCDETGVSVIDCAKKSLFGDRSAESLMLLKTHKTTN